MRELKNEHRVKHNKGNDEGEEDATWGFEDPKENCDEDDHGVNWGSVAHSGDLRRI